MGGILSRETVYDVETAQRNDDIRMQPLGEGEGSASGITIQTAAREGRLSVVTNLLQQFTVCTCDGVTRRRKCQKCKIALVNSTDEEGFTALHYAAKYAAKFGNTHKHSDILGKLIEHDADVKKVSDVDHFTALHLAAYQPSHSTATSDAVQCTMQRLVDLKLDVHKQARYGSTPLHVACARNNKEAVGFLLQQKGIERALDKVNARGNTILHEACLSTGDCTEVLESVLSKLNNNPVALGKLLLMPNSSKQTPLHLACRYGKTSAAEKLLEYAKKASNTCKVLQGPNKNKSIPIFLACRKKNDKLVVETLLGDSYIQDIKLDAQRSDGATILHLLAQLGWSAAAEMVVAKDDSKALVKKADNEGKTPLHWAVETSLATDDQRKDMIQVLLDADATALTAVTADGHTPLLLAVKAGKASTFTLLRERGASLDDKNATKQNAVHIAAEFNHGMLSYYKESVDLFQEEDSVGNTPLHLAAATGPVRCVLNYQFGLQHNSSETISALVEDLEKRVYPVNHRERTPLHMAAENGHSESVKTLLNCSVKEPVTEIVSNYGPALKPDESFNTPLHLAATKGHLEAASELVSHQPKGVKDRNYMWWTPLHCAASAGHDQVVALLLEKKAKIDPKDRLSMTPLHLAALKGHLKVVQTLLKHNTKISAVNNDGMNALDLAIESGHTEVVRAFVNDTRWKKAMRNESETKLTGVTTPMRRLIRKMPDVAFEVFNKCTTTNATPDGKIRPESSEYVVTFDYEFVEDYCQDYDWREDPVYNKEDHPLQIMVDCNQKTLYKHPLVTNLLNFKWHRAVYLYIANVMFYIFFLSFLTAFALLLPNPLSETCVAVASGTFGNASQSEGCGFANRSSIQCGECGFTNAELAYRYFFSGVLFVCISVRLAMEVFQSVGMKLRYCFSAGSYENWIEITLYLCSIVFLSTVGMPCLCPANWQWQFGAFTVFLAWIECGIFFRKLPYFGIYIVMFVSIVKTFLWIALPAFLLVLAFAIAFYMTFFIPSALFAASPFATPGLSIVKTMVMGVGEMDFQAVFQLTSANVSSIDLVPESIPYPGVSYLLWVLFLILMPILLMNLLTSLAVDDVGTIRAEAEYQKFVLEVDLVLSTEEALVPCRSRFVPSHLQSTLRPNKPRKVASVVSEQDLSSKTIGDALNYEAVSPHEQLQQQTARLTAELEKLTAKISTLQQQGDMQADDQ